MANKVGAVIVLCIVMVLAVHMVEVEADAAAATTASTHTIQKCDPQCYNKCMAEETEEALLACRAHCKDACGGQNNVNR
ncbi:hypothetical protein BVRB_5g119610 [Beta vulgaris subsp. vulgaris]|nr:hypothetical protein BVRB_5g119610 [Beta vulgaris subsp. vulgaris]